MNTRLIGLQLGLMKAAATSRNPANPKVLKPFYPTNIIPGKSVQTKTPTKTEAPKAGEGDLNDAAATKGMPQANK